MIWFKTVTVEQANNRGRGTMMEHIGVQITEIGPDYVKATMPVDQRTKQPRGILHGGASVVLAEGIASMAGNFVLNPDTHYAVGLDINANHIRPVNSGCVEGTARPLHLGRKTQVWEINITQESKLVCISRLTLAILAKSE